MFSKTVPSHVNLPSITWTHFVKPATTVENMPVHITVMFLKHHMNEQSMVVVLYIAPMDIF